MQFDSAEADCDKALKLELSVKTLLRRGTARRGKQDIEGARRDFKHALDLEPNNRCVQLLKSPATELARVVVHAALAPLVCTMQILSRNGLIGHIQYHSISAGALLDLSVRVP